MTHGAEHRAAWNGRCLSQAQTRCASDRLSVEWIPVFSVAVKTQFADVEDQIRLEIIRVLQLPRQRMLRMK